jgi:quinone-modifying oxidoreductase subunit QmoA
MVKEKVEMVVLATGMVPTTEETKIPADIEYDDYGFITSGVSGIYAAGCSKRPVDVATSVRDATGAALKAIQSVAGGGKNG